MADGPVMLGREVIGSASADSERRSSSSTGRADEITQPPYVVSVLNFNVVMCFR